MTVQLVDGDIFKSICNFITNPVNCVGVSGAGLALEFKRRYPNAQRKYEERCKRNRLKVGTVYLTSEHNEVTNECERMIFYFPTKIQPKFKSEERYIYEGLVALRQMVLQYQDVDGGLLSVALPALGCGRGGLDFARVESAVRYVFKNWPQIQVELYTPGDR